MRREPDGTFETQNLMWQREKKEVWKDGEEENGRFWDDESLDFPLELLQDPLQGHLGPQERGRGGGEHINFLPFRSSSFDLRLSFLAF